MGMKFFGATARYTQSKGSAGNILFRPRTFSRDTSGAVRSSCMHCEVRTMPGASGVRMKQGQGN